MPPSATISATLPAWSARVASPSGGAIREARPSEYPAVEDILVEAFTTGCWVSDGYRQGLRSLARRAETMVVWVATDAADRPLGVVLTPRVEFWAQDHFTFSILAVGRAGRGRGIGSALVDHAIALARAYGFATIQINSSPQMSQAHRLYYAKGFVRRLERETAFVSEHDERLLALTYRVPDPLPPDEVIHVDPLPRPEGLPPFGRRPDKSAWPQSPAGQVDAAGAFLPDRATPDEALTRARQTAERFGAAHVLARSAGDDAALIEAILDDLWAGAQTVLWSPDPEAGDAALRVFFARLDTLDRRLARRGPFLHGTRPGRADAYLFSVLLAYDLSWRAGFPAQGAVADWPHLWRLVRLAVPKAALTHAELQAAGVEPWADGTFHQPFGPLPPIPGLADVRAEWLTSPTTLRRRRPPLDPTVPATPYSGDWPAAAGPLRARVDALADHVRDLAGAGDPAVDRLTAVIATDLVRPLSRLAHGSAAEDQITARRLFCARLGWFEARLKEGSTPPSKGRDHVAGDEATAADSALASVLRELDAGLVGVLAPIDPVLADFPRLTAYLARCPGR